MNIRKDLLAPLTASGAAKSDPGHGTVNHRS